MSKDELITFEEFTSVCEEAGLAVDNPEQMYSDFRYGRAMADLADELITSTEAEPSVAPEEHLARLESLLNDMYSDSTWEQKYKSMIALASEALRYAAEYLSDPEKDKN